MEADRREVYDKQVCSVGYNVLDVHRCGGEQIPRKSPAAAGVVRALIPIPDSESFIIRDCLFSLTY